MSCILVTGGAGFMGSQLVRTLADAGWDVVVLDKLTYAGKRAFLEGVSHRFIERDINIPGRRELAFDVDAAIDRADCSQHFRHRQTFTRCAVGS